MELRLDQLSSKGIIMKHRYSIPYEWKYYGYMYRYRVKYRPPLFNHIYYLLDLSKTRQIDELLFLYLTKKEEEWKADRVAGKTKIQNQPSFSFAWSVVTQSLPVLAERAERVYNKQYFSPSELQQIYRKLTEPILYMFRYLREYYLSAVKNRVYLPGYPLQEEEGKQLKEIIDFFTSKGFSLQDILIRCSTEYTLIERDRYYLDGLIFHPLKLPMVHYSILWHSIEQHRLFKNSNGLQI